MVAMRSPSVGLVTPPFVHPAPSHNTHTHTHNTHEQRPAMETHKHTDGAMDLLTSQPADGPAVAVHASDSPFYSGARHDDQQQSQQQSQPDGPADAEQTDNVDVIEEGEEAAASLQSFLGDGAGDGNDDDDGAADDSATATPALAAQPDDDDANQPADFETDFSTLAVSASSHGTSTTATGPARSADSSALDLLTATSDAFLSTSQAPRKGSGGSGSGSGSAGGSAKKEHNGLDSGPPSNGPTPMQSPLSLRPSSRQGSASKLPSLNAPASQASSAPVVTSRLSASNSTENLFAVADLSPSAASVAASSSATAPASAAAQQPKTVTRRIFSMFNPFGSSSPSAAPASSPSPPPPHTGLNAAAQSTAAPPANVTAAAPSTPLPSSAASSAGALPPATPSLALTATPPAVSLSSSSSSFGVPVVPRSYTYQDFAAKMKLPGAQDLVRTLKSYVKTVQSPDWLARHSQPPADASAAGTGAGAGASEFERVRQEYNDVISGILRLIRYKHPLWKGSSEEEIDNSLESIEKFLTSKLYDRLFWNLFPADRARDRQLADKLFVLHTWVAPRHLDLPVHCRTDLSVWDHPAEELRNMDKFKSPRDKLVCLLNCCHIINSRTDTTGRMGPGLGGKLSA